MSLLFSAIVVQEALLEVKKKLLQDKKQEEVRKCAQYIEDIRRKQSVRPEMQQLILEHTSIDVLMDHIASSAAPFSQLQSKAICRETLVMIEVIIAGMEQSALFDDVQDLYNLREEIVREERLDPYLQEYIDHLYSYIQSSNL